MTQPISVNKSTRGGDSMDKATRYSKISRWLSCKEATDERSQPGSRRQISGRQTTDSRGRTIDSMRLQGKVDAWEMAKLDKIRKRYEKMKITILEWESNKKSKAKQHLERKQILERRQARALSEYRDEVLRIDKFAEEAKAIMEERKRNDELVVLEKEKRMRSMGRVPRRCLCF
ncbi:remorin 1.4-like [Zingiber officinale]|uniref:Remorin C-terminal domain-containing protein n=1 Tax=Zingiber officinale TaxID=94328 RepID=A0A8J5G505_ZINOF|nr:remorin 1.4-like [Zingiber officinale]KAG6499911.1 hypothetical protein ZIOFF_039723 [Zingiber officinale]